MATGRLDRGTLVEEAVTRTGEEDFGEPSWQEGLDRLLDSLRSEARLHEIGVEIAASQTVDYLANRLAINAWRRDHPEVADTGIERPIFIVGQPRTGTTILFDLLAQDPALRVPLTWEVDLPAPPPETATYGSDPRIGEVQANLDMAELLIPGFTSFHSLGALLGQECVRITAGDFRSMIFATQYRVPTYNHWLLHDADFAPAYRWHRRYLQHLQSRHPAEQWLLKSPAHLWHLQELASEYPDAFIVQTHRDPLKVVASVSALVANLRQMASDETSVADAAGDWTDDIFLGLDRGMAARDRNTFSPDQIFDVQFEEFCAEPFSVISRLYARLGRELTAEAEQRMRTFLAGNPGDGGGDRYRFADTGLDAGQLRERSRPYQERFGVVSEPVR
jgi:Sulfotransferase family